MEGFASLLCILFNVTESSFVSNGCYGTCFKHVIAAKQGFSISVGTALIFTWKVKVDIRSFVTVKAKEGFKGDIVTVTVHRLSANRTILWRHIEAGAVFTMGEKFAVFTVGPNIVRFKGVNLGNTWHTCNKAGTNGASGTNKVAVSFAVRNKLLGCHIKNGEAVLVDWA